MRTYIANALVSALVALGVVTFATAGFMPPPAAAAHFLFLADGTCPAGFTEDTTYDGKMIRITRASHANVAGTGGSDSVTPTGSNSAPAFTGSSGTVPAETFTGSSATSSSTSAGTPAGTNGTGTVTPSGTVAWPAGVPTYTGTVNTLAVTAHTVVSTKQGSSAGNVVTTATHAITGVPGGTVAWPAGVPTFTGSSATTSAEVVSWPAGVPTFTGSSSTTSAETFTGSALGTHSHTVTATGTNGTAAFTPEGTVAAPTFTGDALDNRPAYVNLIVCKPVGTAPLEGDRSNSPKPAGRTQPARPTRRRG